MTLIEQLENVSVECIKSWIESHITCEHGFLPYAIDHYTENGKFKTRSISYDEFYSGIEKDILSDDITFSFIGCGIKGPFNLYKFIENKNGIDSYSDEFLNNLKDNIINYASSNEYLKQVSDKYIKNSDQALDLKLLLGLFYLAYINLNKNKIYELINEYKTQTSDLFNVN